MPNHSKLPDLLRPGLDLVICGTAAGSVSAKAGQYYAGPGNRFWSVLHEVDLTDRLLDPSECELLLHHGIGLTDVVKDQAGGDAEIAFGGHGSNLEQRLRPHAPRILRLQREEGSRRGSTTEEGPLRPSVDDLRPDDALRRAVDERCGAKVVGFEGLGGAGRAGA